MGFISEAIRLYQNGQAEKRNRQRGEDYLRQLAIEELERRGRRSPQESEQ